ncbi:MAG: CBS domain-containing protein [Candidatus Methanomethylicia archaeon]|uniref:CBS domain-containing protein n=1 Tax=Thermodesulfobium narugense TaxID=184064 RepID=A0A7C5PAH9_9BACT|nr:CBS domain-containing protein [Candidatus Methanomethylicia archaeon]
MKKVRDIMTKNVVKSDKDSTIYDLARLMDQNRIGCIVIAEDDKPIGIVTERDIITKCLAKEMNPREVKAKDIMSSPVITIEPDAEMLEAAKVMVSRMIRRLPVVENNKLVGIITTSDMIRESSKGKRKEDSLIYLAAEYEVF